MQQTGAVGMSGPPWERGMSDAAVLPSRWAALHSLRDGLLRQAGPVLLTGHPGVGKTWLARLLRARTPADWRWVSLDLSSSITPAGLGRGILRGLGLPTPAASPGQAVWRAEIEDALAESDADRRRWILVADEAHTATDEVLEELRVLSNRLGEPGGLGGLILVGQTSLVRRLERRPLDALGLRLDVRVHLRPLGVDELRDGLARLDPTWGRDQRAIERLHRDTGGIPGLAFRQAISDRPPVCPPGGRPEVPRPVPDQPRIEADRPALDLTTALPVRPPLQVGDGVVEVGWDAMSGAAAVEADVVELADASQMEQEEVADGPSPARHPGPVHTSLASEGPEIDGLVTDRYAALQAWNEWSRSKELESDRRSPDDHGDDTNDPRQSAPAGDELDREEPNPEQEPCPGMTETDRSAWQGVRVEGQHGFAPYSQLFSRLRLPRDVP